MLQRIFSGKISNSDDITVKYLDDDGDKITLLTDSDLTVALHFHKILRLFVFVNGQEQTKDNSSDQCNQQGNLIDAKTFRTELQQIRNSVQTILDRLQGSSVTQGKEVSTTPTPSNAPTSTVVSSTTREFDPLKNVSSSQQNQQRSSTPDSIRSKSSTSHGFNNNEQKSYQTAAMGNSIHTFHHEKNRIDSFLGQSQSLESNETNTAPTASYGTQQMSTSQYAPSVYANVSNQDQQVKANTFGPPTTSYPGMPPLPNSTPASRFSNSFPSMNAQQNSITPSAFNPATSTVPTTAASAVVQQSNFIGQQSVPPPQAAGFYAQQQSYFQQRPPMPGFNPMNNNNNSNNNYPPQAQPPAQQPPPSSSPATINPSFIAPPPMTSQQPYGGYPPQTAYYNPSQTFQKAN